MNRFLTATALVAMAALTAAPALAATATTTTKTTPTTVKPAPKAVVAKPAKPTVLTYKLIDANHDGKISLGELQKYFPKLTKAEFAKFDASKDGFYDHVELAAFYKAQNAAPAPVKPAPVKTVTKTTTTTKTTTMKK